MPPPELFNTPKNTNSLTNSPIPVVDEQAVELLHPSQTNEGNCLTRVGWQALQWHDSFAVRFGRVLGYAYGPSCLFAKDTHRCCGPWAKSSERHLRGCNTMLLEGQSLIWFLFCPPPYNIFAGISGLICGLSQGVASRSENLSLTDSGTTAPAAASMTANR